MKNKRGNKDSQETKRMLVVRYLKAKRGTHQEAAALFGLSKSGVDKICSRYKRSGMQGLKSGKRGVKGGKKLKGKQADEIRRLIRNKYPDQLKLPFGLWTREAVSEAIRNRFGVELSRWQVGRYLKAWGYTPQKPIGKAFEQKPAKVRKWLEEEYPAVKKRATEEKAVIYFGDETGMRSDHQAGWSYAPRGQTPVVKKTGRRFSLNMISAISNKGYLQFISGPDFLFQTKIFCNFFIS